ncbi:MAG: alpha/beta fold hydrolase [Pseudomonadota bacterium]
MTELNTFETDLTLLSGQVLPAARLVYQTFGTLNSDGSNAILFPTRFGGTHDQNAFLINPGMALDPERYFIIVPNMLGNGVSSSPSNTDAPFSAGDFPGVSIYDNVTIQHQLIEDVFDIERFVMVVGWSMGAQQAFQWASRYPAMVPKLACLCGTAKTTEHNRVFLESLRAAIVADQSFQGGHYDSGPSAGLRATGRIYAGWAYSQAWYRARLYRELGYDTLDAFLVEYWDALFEKRDANNIMSMTWTWIQNDISANDTFKGDFAAALRAIEAETLLMPCATDLYFCTADSEAELAHLKRGRLVEIASDWGHMAGAGQHVPDTEFIDRNLKILLEA